MRGRRVEWIFGTVFLVLFLGVCYWASPGYMRVMAYKAAASRMVVLPASGGIVLPDVRVAVGVALSLVCLLVGWIRSDASVPRPSGPHDVTHDVVGQL